MAKAEEHTRYATRRPGWWLTWGDWTLLGTIVLFASAVRLISVTFPPWAVVDEFWYARDACFYWLASIDRCGMANLIAPDRDVTTWLATYGELTPEHPPLAKLLIGAPIALLGYSAGVWRLASVAAGVLTVIFVYLLARESSGSRTAAAGVSALVAIDFPHVIHSRLAMLEIFVALFAVAAFHFCLLDRRQIAQRVEGRPSHRFWRVAAGIAGGAAVASKLSGAAIVAGVLVLILAWEVAALRRARQPSSSYLWAAASIVLLLVIVPVATYMATYVGRLDGVLLSAPWSEGSWTGAWLERQSYMLGFHADKPSTTPSPWALPMTAEPLAYVLEQSRSGIREILLFGNPVLWWLGFAAVVYAAACWTRRKRTVPAGLVVVAFLASYAGWLSITLTGRPVHLFYAVPVIPFIYLALALLVVDIASTRAGRAMVATALVGAAVAFVYYFPIITGQELAVVDWQPRACSALALWLEQMAACGLTGR